MSFTVNDGLADSNARKPRTSRSRAVNDAPVLAGIEGTALAYTENDPATAISGDDRGQRRGQHEPGGATIRITGNYQNGQDVLSFTDTGAITWDVEMRRRGTLTLSGSDTVAELPGGVAGGEVPEHEREPQQCHADGEHSR